MNSNAKSTMNSLKRCKPALGTYVTIALEGPFSHASLIEHSSAAFHEINRIENLMSFHNGESELSRLNSQAQHGPMAISRDMATVLKFGLLLSQLTEGQFDLAVAPHLIKSGSLPDHGMGSHFSGTWEHVHLNHQQVHFSLQLQLDLGGIAKGYAVDRAFSIIPEDMNVLVDAGGDLRVRPWKKQPLHVRIPGQYETGSFLEIPMASQAVATSSKYFNDGVHPVICPQSGSPIEDSRSISVFAQECMVADALTKVVFLCSNSETLLQRFGASALLVERNGRTEWKRGD